MSITTPDDQVNKKIVNTLAIDVGGTGVKASVLDDAGLMEHARVRVETPYPLPPQRLIATIADLTRELPPFDRISLGFPGMIRDGIVLTAPHFVSPSGPGGKVASDLLAGWTGFNLAKSLTVALAKPAKVANDADLQGAAVIEGKGLELMVTLGTGVGTAVYYQGRLCPHLEFAEHPFRKDETYNEQLGEATRARIGTKKWSTRVQQAIVTLYNLMIYDHCFVGGGNSHRIKADLGPKVSIVDNDAGILGGIKLWEREIL
jgi:polyphosphate glucokinase